ncbi:hypothetical protein [Sphingomonas nostoxanthinifaciens]|uniref:hypothetical protein n=1 Tax=Sphingomonas nostoxanthinifaciens TaxID=2872652 RepID=UPI001CC20279|nr:hypothetical protein [Sphingomonas nostoxanthinifaciens]UAK23735.1 hypothetical protein K8P63_15310 [Sphingomonas nostoxanthinifaciens]
MLLVAPIALVTACHGTVGAPSLALRPVEAQPVELPAPASETETPLDPTLAGRVEALVATAEDSQRAFDARRATTEKAVAAARGAPAGSEAWTVAQQELSALVVARGPVHDINAQVDALRQEPGAAGTANRALIDATVKQLAAMDAAQAAAIEALQRRLR